MVTNRTSELFTGTKMGEVTRQCFFWHRSHVHASPIFSRIDVHTFRPEKYTALVDKSLSRSSLGVWFPAIGVYNMRATQRPSAVISWAYLTKNSDGGFASRR